MRTDLKTNAYSLPMPVMLAAAYSEDDTPSVMVVTWGGICTKYLDKIALNIDSFHKTARAISERMAFTVSVPDASHWKTVDYIGSVSGDDVPDKFTRSGLHAVRSRYVDAPVITDFPVSLECRVIDIAIHDMMRVTGQVINVSAEYSLLNDTDGIDALLYDNLRNSYISSGRVLGYAEKFRVR
ncbi:MAG: flavin reductase family protein [Synergistaceae bacterium]|nr:flavin reductase family protein [Synergistaceae bacterium]